eukprot:5966863-Amphidinium_carterae.1
MAGWYARKDNDNQFQIKAGVELQRLGGDMDGRSITVGNYMELKVAYKQIHRTVIENKGTRRSATEMQSTPVVHMPQ